MTARISRRAALLGAATAAGAGVLPVLAAPAAPVAHPDAELFALLDCYGPLLAESGAADAVDTELWDRFVEQEPPRPAALRVRFGDEFPGGVQELCPDGRWRWLYDTAAINDLREAPEPTMLDTIGDDENPLSVEVPDPRRIARRAEILAAHDRWWAECNVLKERLGVFTADEVAADACDRLDELTVAILETAPRTMAGLARKAQWASRPGIPKDTAAVWSVRIVADVVALAEAGEDGA